MTEVPPEYLLAAGYAWVYDHYPNAGYLNEYYGTEDTMPEDPEGWEFERFTEVYTDISVERLRELSYYDAENKSYVLPKNFCFGEEKYPVITFVSDYGESIEIYYDIIDSNGKVIGSRLIRIEIINDIQWRYKGCY